MQTPVVWQTTKKGSCGGGRADFWKVRFPVTLVLKIKMMCAQGHCNTKIILGVQKYENKWLTNTHRIPLLVKGSCTPIIEAPVLLNKQDTHICIWQCKY